MKDEINAMHNNNAWTLCDLPPGRKCISTKWVFKIKRDGNNKFERFRACIVARRFSQVFGINFDKTYAPVVRIDTVRHLFAVRAFYNLHILHADAKTAFINGNSDVALYIQQPEGFINPRFPHKVLCLNKSLHGLKQAPRIWYLLLCSRIMEYGFVPCESDPCIHFSPERHMIIAVYVDDILIFGDNSDQCVEVYTYLAQQFRLNNLEAPTTFLGLNISRDWNQHTITIDHTGYIDHLLQQFNMLNAVPTKTPLNPTLPLQKRQHHEKPADSELYQSITGSLNHLAVYSRPDIPFTVSKLSQYNKDPSNTHLKAAHHVLRYIKGTRKYSIMYGGTRSAILIFNGYSDASHGGDFDDGKSTTGWVFMINNGPVSWSSHKQSTVAISTMEVEYMALSEAGREAIA